MDRKMNRKRDVESNSKQDTAAPISYMNSDNLMKMLDDAASSLLFTSESDYPITIFKQPNASPCPMNLTIDNAKPILLSITAIDVFHRQYWTQEAAVEEVSLDWFFQRCTIVQDSLEPTQYTAMPRWQQLESIVNNNLLNVRVFRLGQASDYGFSGSIDIFIIGQSRLDQCTLVGVHTISVET
jgi:Nuclease A inhibitor-like protein